MALAPGIRLGVYEVTAQIGAGGMGEVYRARDTRLDRDVAVKVLPDLSASDPDRLARFEREARTLALLNHPHIAQIYGVEDAGGATALIMELVEGEDLAQWIARGPMPLEDALPIARQIAEALEAAHEAGIIHRDLKPSNIRRRPDGAVKVLDFGLAKAGHTSGQVASGGEARGADGASALAITSPAMTQTGTILGTAAYMSPEQAKGRAADRRSDIWAFGAVLYELLSGERAFKGDDVPDTLAAVLRADPAWSVLPADTPPSIRRLLRRCLQKDARQRLQHIGDARLELTDVDLEAGAVATAAKLRNNWPLVAAAAIVGALAAGLAAWTLAPSRPAPAVTRFTIQPPALMNRVAGAGASMTLSPDGRTLVYVVGGASPGLERRRLDDASTERVRGTEGGSRPFFSPDGQWVGFFAGGYLKKVPAAGGTPITITEASPNARGAWGDDGTIVVARPDLRKVASTGGSVDVVFGVGSGGQFTEPEFLPGSKIVLVGVRRPPNAGHIEAINLETGERHRLAEGSSPKLAATGDLVFVRQGRLWAAKFDAKRLALVTEPVQLAESVIAGEDAPFAMSGDGSLIYMSAEASTSLMWLDRMGGATTAVASVAGLRNPRLSPDGKRVVANGTALADLWIFDFERGSRLRLTTEGYNRGSAWSPDGERIAFFSAPSSPGTGVDVQDLFVVPSAGGAPARLLERPGPQWADSWAPDGKSLVFDDGPGFSRDLWLLPLGETPRPLVATRFNERAGMFSPVGGLVAFVSDESGADEVYVLPVPGPGQKTAISVNGGRQPMWSRDGRELFYREGDAMMVVAVQHDPFRASPPRKLFDLPGAQYGLDPYVADYDVAPDGRFIAVRRDAAPEINVVLNWIVELRRALGQQP